MTFLLTVDFRATENLEGTVLPVNYRTSQYSFSELPILSTVGAHIPVDYNFKSYKSCQQLELTFCQQCELTFLSTVAFRATKSLEGTVLPVNYQSWQHSFSELPILSTVGADIPVDCSFKSYQIPTILRADIPLAIRATKNL